MTDSHIQMKETFPCQNLLNNLESPQPKFFVDTNKNKDIKTTTIQGINFLSSPFSNSTNTPFADETLSQNNILKEESTDMVINFPVKQESLDLQQLKTQPFIQIKSMNQSRMSTDPHFLQNYYYDDQIIQTRKQSSATFDNEELIRQRAVTKLISDTQEFNSTMKQNESSQKVQNNDESDEYSQCFESERSESENIDGYNSQNSEECENNSNQIILQSNVQQEDIQQDSHIVNNKYEDLNLESQDNFESDSFDGQSYQNMNANNNSYNSIKEKEEERENEDYSDESIEIEESEEYKEQEEQIASVYHNTGIKKGVISKDKQCKSEKRKFKYGYKNMTKEQYHQLRMKQAQKREKKRLEKENEAQCGEISKTFRLVLVDESAQKVRKVYIPKKVQMMQQLQKKEKQQIEDKTIKTLKRTKLNLNFDIFYFSRDALKPLVRTVHKKDMAFQFQVETPNPHALIEVGVFSYYDNIEFYFVNKFKIINKFVNRKYNDNKYYETELTSDDFIFKNGSRFEFSVKYNCICLRNLENDAKTSHKKVNILLRMFDKDDLIHLL